MVSKLRSFSVYFSLTFSCSNEPLEGEFGTEEIECEVDDSENENSTDTNEEEPSEINYATAKLDGEPFVANTFEIENITSEAIRLSFFSNLE